MYMYMYTTPNSQWSIVANRVSQNVTMDGGPQLRGIYTHTSRSIDTSAVFVLVPQRTRQTLQLEIQ